MGFFNAPHCCYQATFIFSSKTFFEAHAITLCHPIRPTWQARSPCPAHLPIHWMFSCLIYCLCLHRSLSLFLMTSLSTETIHLTRLASQLLGPLTSKTLSPAPLCHHSRGHTLGLVITSNFITSEILFEASHSFYLLPSHLALGFQLQQSSISFGAPHPFSIPLVCLVLHFPPHSF